VYLLYRVLAYVLKDGLQICHNCKIFNSFLSVILKYGIKHCFELCGFVVGLYIHEL
jgi:hypothetical protein